MQCTRLLEIAILIKENNWIIGIGNILFNENKKYAHAFHIYIDKKYRKKGLGSKILQHLETIAQEKNMKKMTLRLMPNNESGKYLYKNINYLTI